MYVMRASLLSVVLCVKIRVCQHSIISHGAGGERKKNVEKNKISKTRIKYLKQ